MKAGDLRHRVTLQQLVTGSPQNTTAGEPDQAWGDVATVWAAVEPLQGRALEAAQMIQSEVTGRIRIRYRAGVTAAMRVSFDGRLYDIKAVVDPDERHRELVLYTAQGVNDG